jgi:hypothetical protein
MCFALGPSFRQDSACEVSTSEGPIAMFLNYFALVMILTVLVILFYTFIYIHELPYEAAKHRNHPQQDAIYVACWLSLFTLHAIWPLVYIWALSHKEPAEHSGAEGDSPKPDFASRLAQLENRLQHLETQHARPLTGSIAK